jgi:hypothetical protein
MARRIQLRFRGHLRNRAVRANNERITHTNRIVLSNYYDAVSAFKLLGGHTMGAELGAKRAKKLLQGYLLKRLYSDLCYRRTEHTVETYWKVREAMKNRIRR